MKSQKNWVYQLTRFLVTLYFTLYHRLSVYGKEKIPRGRTVIVASNHASYLDPPLVGYAFFPGYLKFIAWEKLFSFAPFGAFLRTMGAVPVSPENKNSSAALLRLVMGFLQEGYNVFICPEGHRTEDGRLQPLEGGVAIMSLKTGAPVIPTYASGTWRAFAPHMKFPRPHKLTVVFGDPIDPAALPEGLNEKEKRRYILEKIEEFYRAEDAKDKEKYPLKD
ncbi:MAG: lysophospholipid acyltransferase family protein [Synergistaceae bacterium]|nr:lysophospholipid acyltransferase family protein [Synergistaceae bacterium]